MKKVMVAGVLALFLLVAGVASVTPRQASAPEPVEAVEVDRDSQFIQAITNADVEKVRAMVKSYPKYAAGRFAGGKLAIVDAVERFRFQNDDKYASRLELVRFLLDSGADPNAKAHNGLPILCAAVAHTPGDELPLLLLQRGADPRVRGGEFLGSSGSAIHQAALSHRLALVEAIINKGENPNAVFMGRTPLEMAEGHQDQAMVDLLHRKGAR